MLIRGAALTPWKLTVQDSLCYTTGSLAFGKQAVEASSRMFAASVGDAAVRCCASAAACRIVLRWQLAERCESACVHVMTIPKTGVQPGLCCSRMCTALCRLTAGCHTGCAYVGAALSVDPHHFTLLAAFVALVAFD